LHQRLLVAELAGLQLVDQHIQGFFVLPVAAEAAVGGGLADIISSVSRRWLRWRRRKAGIKVSMGVA